MSVEHLLKTKKEYKNVKKQDIQNIYIKTFWTKSALNMKWFMEILKIYLQPFTEYLGPTLVFMRSSALREKFNFYFSTVFC